MLITDVDATHGRARARPQSATIHSDEGDLISGYTEDAFRQRLDSDSGIDFLPKPFSLKQFAIKVRDVIGVGLA